MNYSLYLADDRRRPLGLEGEHEGRRFNVHLSIDGLGEQAAADWIDWAAWLGYGARAGLTYEQTQAFKPGVWGS